MSLIQKNKYDSHLDQVIPEHKSQNKDFRFNQKYQESYLQKSILKLEKRKGEQLLVGKNGKPDCNSPLFFFFKTLDK